MTRNRKLAELGLDDGVLTILTLQGYTLKRTRSQLACVGLWHFDGAVWRGNACGSSVARTIVQHRDPKSTDRGLPPREFRFCDACLVAWADRRVGKVEADGKVASLEELAVVRDDAS